MNDLRQERLGGCFGKIAAFVFNQVSTLESLTTKELVQVLAGGDSYIRTKNGEVKGLAVTTTKNPEAPDIIIVAKGPRKIANALLLLESNKYVPVYVKQAVNAWKYIGHYKAVSYKQDLATIEQYRKSRPIDKVDGILFLMPQEEFEISVTQKSESDVENKELVRISAIQTVVNYFKEQGFQIHDRQSESCGYDLLVEKGKEILKIVVKETMSSEQKFIISQSEKLKAADPLWRLALVTQVSTQPQLEVLNAEEMEAKFKFDALCWECFSIEHS